MKLEDIDKALGVVDTTRIVLKENRDGVYAGSKTILFLQGKGEIFGPRQLGYPSVSKDSMEFYAELFANAPEWLRLLVEQNKAVLARNEELQRRVQKLEDFAGSVVLGDDNCTSEDEASDLLCDFAMAARKILKEQDDD